MKELNHYSSLTFEVNNKNVVQQRTPMKSLSPVL